ncbi:hypothetical protein CkaCkLH20_09020 [Colletotrichum karsti]|uniref:Uncharacterized protein n=1 Tax=Colletotrichum karsti TaxID=1095194 RepID=A0A9P6I3Y8_9PEZI|nr:uncharacterized protein CkaCkLH20_09020 [Colletotrichum karsti]KAF9873561.1 hypothetical protein CkaCkLH20_09020 [Colletotrichum karsti]
MHFPDSCNSKQHLDCVASPPLKVKVAVRDHWTNEESPLQKALKELKEVLGLDIVVEPDWQLLLNDLDAEYPDKGDFAAAVAGTVEVWSKSATELLNDDKNAEWTESLLEKLKSTYSTLRLFIEVSRDEQASTSWSEERGGFLIALPKRQLTNPAELFPVFKGGIIDCFGSSSSSNGHTHQLPPYTMSPRISSDEWADVGLDVRASNLSLSDSRRPSSSPTAKAAVPEFIPRADAMPRPDDLLNKPPYHLFVYARSAHEIEIQASHSGTLKFLAEYLKKWRRVNYQLSSKPPAVEVKLHNSAFGLGAIIDRLVLVAENRNGTFTITPTIVLSLIEGVLGYRPTYSDAHSWTYRRDVEFRSM